MTRCMTTSTRIELIEVLRHRYLLAHRTEKARILDEFAAVSGYHRKHAVRPSLPMICGSDGKIAHLAYMYGHVPR